MVQMTSPRLLQTNTTLIAGSEIQRMTTKGRGSTDKWTGGPGNERKWVSPLIRKMHPMKAHFLQEAHAQSAPEEQIFRE